MLGSVGKYVKRWKKAWKNAKFDFSRAAKCPCAFGSYGVDWGGYLKSTRGK